MRHIQIEEDLAFERRSWAVQRVAWVAILLTIAAAALGFLGSSALSKRTAEAEGIRVEYEKLSRMRAPAEMRVTVAPPFPAARELGLWVGGDFCDHIAIERITPEPVRMSSDASGLFFVFALHDPDSPHTIRMGYKAEASGRLQARLGVSGGHQRAHFRVFVYP